MTQQAVATVISIALIKYLGYPVALGFELGASDVSALPLYPRRLCRKTLLLPTPLPPTSDQCLVSAGRGLWPTPHPLSLSMEAEYEASSC